jgi:hypothetical protein
MSATTTILSMEAVTTFVFLNPAKEGASNPLDVPANEAAIKIQTVEIKALII